jgi:chromosome segregation ATPase
MDDRNYDFSTLSERISAQTQAYVEFSSALVKIIEQTAQIRDSVNDNNNHLLEDYRQLNNKFQTLLIDLNKFFSDTKHQHENIDNDLNTIKSSLISYENKLKDLIKEMDNNNKELFGMIENIVNHTKQIKDDSVIYKADVVSDIQKLNTKIDNLNTTIVEQNLLVSSFKKSIDKYKIFIWAACGLIAILGTLSQFGIVSITWFKK